MLRRPACLLVALSALAPIGAAAQPATTDTPEVAIIHVTHGTHGEISGSDEHFSWAYEELRGHADAEGRGVIGSAAPTPEGRTEGVTLRRLAALEEVEARIVEARRQAGHLDEAGALTSLTAALRLAEGHADLPGSSRWIAEVHTALGVVAGQAGLDRLMQAELASAALLDPSRGLGAAEARPSVTARAAAIAREVATRPHGSFIVRSDAPGATVFLDDRPFGSVPALVEAPIGRHVLRVEAADHRPYGAMIDLFEGRRPEMSVELAPTPLASLRGVIFEQGAAYELDALVDALARSRRMGRPVQAWLVDVGAGERERALITRCSPDGCDAAIRLEGEVGELPAPAAPLSSGALLARRRADLEWLSASGSADAPPPAWYRRWYVWAPIGVVLVGAAAAATAAARRDPADDLEIIIDFSDLTP